MSENEKEKNLLDAASEWAPDTEATPSAPATEGGKEASATELNPEGGNDYVSFVEAPFEIRTLEISQAQQIADELELDQDLQEIGGDIGGTEDPEVLPELPPEEPLEKDDSQLENLAKAISDQEAALQAQAQEAAGQTEEQQAQELARQIAEDQALAAQMAKEAEEAEKLLETDPELLAALPKQPQPDEQGNLDLSELQSCIETLLFMVDKPVSHKKLQEWLGPSFNEELFVQALEALKARYQSPAHGIELVEVGGGWQLRTKPGRAALAKKLAKIQTQRLSSGGMETLAIVAYRQPVMKEEIDKIRGVDSSYFVRGLMEKKLIEISGRSELPGRPMLYSTTQHFLELFGLKDLSALPPLRELEQMVPASQSKNPDDPADEDPRVREMRRLVGKMKSDTSTTLLYDPKEDEKILQEIRERVKSIPTSTPYLDEQKALEKAAADAAKQAALPENQPEGTQLGLEQAEPPVLAEEQRPEMLDVPPPESIDEPEPSTDHV